MAAPVFYKSASRGIPVTLQSEATTGNGTPVAIPPGFLQHRVNIKANGVIGAGAIQIETADDPSYTGTWSALGGPVSVLTSGQVDVNFSGTYRALRARISTTVTTTSVTVTYTGD